MDRIEALALIVGGAAIVLAILWVIVFPAIGGDRRCGGKEHDYAGNQPTARGEGA